MSFLVTSMAKKDKVPLPPGRIGILGVVLVVDQRNDVVVLTRPPCDDLYRTAILNVVNPDDPLVIENRLLAILASLSTLFQQDQPGMVGPEDELIVFGARLVPVAAEIRPTVLPVDTTTAPPAGAPRGFPVLGIRRSAMGGLHFVSVPLSNQFMNDTNFIHMIFRNAQCHGRR
jgi:hypothetical protein